LDDALSAVNFAFFTFRDHKHPTILLSLDSPFFEMADCSMVSGIRRR